MNQYDYETVAAGQTDQVLGPKSATSARSKKSILQRLVIVPATTGAGDVSIKDGAGSAINVFKAGTLSDLHPIVIELGVISSSGAWQVTTGANVSVIAIGRFL